jgi:hypothetical protein
MKTDTFSRRLGWGVLTTAYIVLASCGDGTEPLIPAALQVVAGDGQEAAVGGAVPVAPSVRVVTSSGKPVPNVPVVFAPGAESGVVVGGTQVTDASGVATVTRWTLGTRAGASTLTATAEGVPAKTFSATTKAGNPATASFVAGGGQSALVGTAVGTAPAVEVLDVYGNAVPGVSVVFAVQSGTLERTSAQTDATGRASPGRWTLGTRSGFQVVTAAPGALPAVTVSATAIADAATQLVIARQPSSSNGSGEHLSVQPIVEFRDRFDNVASSSTLPVTASVASGTSTLSGTATVNAQTGRALFNDLSLTGTGAVQLQFTAPGFQPAVSAAFNIVAVAQCSGPELTLNYSLGQMTRYSTMSTATPRCFNFAASRNAGQEYLVLFENMATRGSGRALFPGVANENDGALTLSVQTRTVSGDVVSAPTVARPRRTAAPANAVHGWDFGDQTVYEIAPKPPAFGAPAALVMRNGALVNASTADVAPGDTIQVYLESIRASIPAGTYKAIIRLATPHIVIAEDLRIFSRDTSFTRATGGLNTPMTDADLQEIAAEYAQNARIQGDHFFSNAHNAATTQQPGRPIAVHSLMFAGSIWGYTYSTTNYFVWDYWVGTDGQTKALAQHPQRNADDLFMHEIAHMRHMGLMERAGLGAGNRGHTWVVEGFARFSERLPIAARLLGAEDPSRIANVTLPYNTAFKNAQGQQTYYYDDVPTYLQTASIMYDGYGASAFVFDYFADQVALAGGNWWSAVADLLINLGAENTANATVAKYLPGLDLGTLFTRARVALYTDDYLPGLPAWTQYHMYNLRASRPTTTNTFAVDPRNSFPRIRPADAFSDSRQIAAGGAHGYVIDGNSAASDFRVDFTPAQVTNGVMTVVRIK